MAQPTEREAQTAFALTHQGYDASLSAVMLDEEQPLEFQIELVGPEKEMLAFCEETIQKGLDRFMQVGEALATIRKARLYKGEHLSFEEYCREKWGFGRHRALHYIQAAETGNNLVTKSHSLAGLNVQQMRLLHPLEPEQQSAAMVKAREIAGKGKVATRHIAQAIRSILPEEVDPIVAEGLAMKAAPSTTEVVMPIVTVDMVTGCFEVIDEQIDRLEYPEGLRNSFATLRSMIFALIQQSTPRSQPGEAG